MNKKYILYFLMTSLIFSSCGKGITSLTQSKGTAKGFKIQEFKFDHFILKSKLDLVDDGKKTDATVLFRIRKDSLIWFNITGSLGIQGMRGILTTDSIKILNRVNKEYGEFSYPELSEKFGINLSYDLIQSIIVGDAPNNADEVTDAVLRDNFYFIIQKENQYNITTQVNPKTRRVQKVTIEQDSSLNKLDISYQDFQLIDEQVFPFSGIISLFYETNRGIIETELNIRHNKVEISDKPLKYPFNVPNKYERN